jgi:hypothetical protein
MSQALVPVMPAAEGHAKAGARANADFIAQLIATSGHAPQTRARRRAEPLEASAAYRALDRGPISPIHALSRSL